MATYTPDVLAALNAQRDWGNSYAAKTGYNLAVNRPYQTAVDAYGGNDYASTDGGTDAFSRRRVKRALTQDEAAALAASDTPMDQRFSALFSPESGSAVGQLRAGMNTPIRLYDNGQLVYEGVGHEAAAKAMEQANGLSASRGSKQANWSIEQQSPNGQWLDMSSQKPGFSNNLLKYGLPAVTSFIPGLNVLTAGLAAGGAAFGGNLLAGESLKNSLIAGGISGLTAGALRGLAPSMGGGASNVTGSGGSAAGGTASAAGSGLSAVPGEILVQASRLGSNAFPLAAAGLSGVGNMALQAAQQPPTEEPMQTVTSRPEPSFSGMGALPIGVAGGLAAQNYPAIGEPAVPVDDEMVVSGNRPGSLSLDAASLAAGLGGAGALGLSNLAVPNAPAKSDTLAKIKAGLSLASMVGGVLGGGQPSGAASAGAAVRPTVNPIFSAQLPEASAQYSGNSLAARDMSGTDWNRYAFGPEKSFFQNAPQPPLAMAEGGEVGGEGYAPREEFAVHGAGTGRSDDIDAKLSDGEYVIDAETVALLGDGSNKAGAERLDQFRVKLRKHKGKNLARGEFSVKAKAPEAYMAGGRK